jgi:pyruvate dehydrogenase E1 component beta subunit
MMLRMNQAISLALADEMRADPSVIVLGEDVAAAEGIFKTSEGLLKEFGDTRVLDTPISEMGFVGAGVGAALSGLRPVVEIMFVEFLGVALDELTTEAAKLHFLSGGVWNVPLVVRASAGAGGGFGAQHSQTLENWFAATPGLKLCVPSGPRTAYGLLRSAVRDDNPVVVLEPRVLYGVREDFDPQPIELGSAELVSTGADVTIVGWGQMVSRIRRAAEASSWTADVIDLLSLVPWDTELVESSVSKTGRLVVVEEGTLSGGWGSTIASHIGSKLFSSLKAPIHRITAPDAHVPFGIKLENRYVPSDEYIADQISELLSKDECPAPWWTTVEANR